MSGLTRMRAPRGARIILWVLTAYEFLAAHWRAILLSICALGFLGAFDVGVDWWFG